MTNISAEAKESIIKKVLSNSGKTLTVIAAENNVACSTLSKWVSRYKAAEKNIGNQPVADCSPSLPERFKHLHETFEQDSVMVGAYCRKNGLYPHQLTQWEAEFMTPNINQKSPQNNTEFKKLRAENKELHQIIRRKDKVLAETMALLVLKKKAADIWGENAED